MRRHATDVLTSTSRLLKSASSASRPAQPPAYYLAALQNPPPVLPARPGKKQRPQRIVYDEDKVRRQFFKDFPFEGLRPTSLVEGFEIREDGVVGEEWTVLSQRGGYPTVEDTIAYTLNLHQHHQHSLASAYAAAAKQFVELRARHEVATQAAQAEHKYYGAQPPLSPFTRYQKIEERALDTLSKTSHSSNEQSRRNRPWTMVVDGAARPTVLQAIEDLDLGRGYFKAWTVAAPVEEVEPEAEAGAGTEAEAPESGKETEEQVGESLETRVAEPVAS